MSLINNSKNVIDVVKQPTIITKTETKENIQEKKINQVENKENIQEKEDIKFNKSNKKNTKSNENEPYKYYYKKDIKKLNLDVCWGTPEEIYNINKFTEPLTLVLKINQLFNSETNSKITNDTTNLDDKIKKLKNDYNFKKINRFKDTIISLIYKIIVYDDLFKDFI